MSGDRLNLSPMQVVALDLRPAVLQTWVHDAVRAYERAAVLLGVEAETVRLRSAQDGIPSTQLLAPTHDVLLRRFSDEVNDGRQRLLFATDHDQELRRIWCRFAVDYMRRPGQALVQRWVLQASVGLAGAANRSDAANMLVMHVMDSPLGDVS